MKFSAELKIAKELSTLIDSNLNGVNIGKSTKERVFNGYYHLSLEHYAGIIQLMNFGFHASASALLRPQFEAVSKGLYFQQVATDQQIQKYLDGESNPKLVTLVKEIEKTLDSKSKPIHRFYLKVKDLLNGFTHGSLEQLHRRFSANELTNNYTEQDKSMVINMATTLAKVAAASAAITAGKGELLKTLMARTAIEEL